MESCCRGPDRWRRGLTPNLIPKNNTHTGTAISHSRHHTILTMCVAPLALHHFCSSVFDRIHWGIRNHRRSQIKQDCYRIERTIEQVRCHQSPIRRPRWRNREMGRESLAFSSVRTPYPVDHIRNHDPRRGTSQKDGRKNSGLFLLRKHRRKPVGPSPSFRTIPYYIP